MPRTGNRIGTVHLGRVAQADDGSYVATLWVVFLFLPIFPLRSEGILLLSEFDNGAGHRNVRYSILNRVPRHWPQIFRLECSRVVCVALVALRARREARWREVSALDTAAVGSAAIC